MNQGIRDRPEGTWSPEPDISCDTMASVVEVQPIRTTRPAGTGRNRNCAEPSLLLGIPATKLAASRPSARRSPTRSAPATAEP